VDLQSAEDVDAAVSDDWEDSKRVVPGNSTKERVQANPAYYNKNVQETWEESKDKVKDNAEYAKEKSTR